MRRLLACLPVIAGLACGNLHAKPPQHSPPSGAHQERVTVHSKRPQHHPNGAHSQTVHAVMAHSRTMIFPVPASHPVPNRFILPIATSHQSVTRANSPSVSGTESSSINQPGDPDSQVVFDLP